MADEPEDYDLDDDEDDDDEEGPEIGVTVEIVGLSLYTHHGVTAAEREIGQRLVLDVRFDVGEERSDELCRVVERGTRQGRRASGEARPEPVDVPRRGGGTSLELFRGGSPARRSEGAVEGVLGAGVPR